MAMLFPFSFILLRYWYLCHHLHRLLFLVLGQGLLWSIIFEFLVLLLPELMLVVLIRLVLLERCISCLDVTKRNCSLMGLLVHTFSFFLLMLTNRTLLYVLDCGFWCRMAECACEFLTRVPMRYI